MNDIKACKKELTFCLNQTKAALANFGTKQIVNDKDVFSLGAQLLYLGQRLTEITEFPLKPASNEAQMVLNELAEKIKSRTTPPIERPFSKQL
jgi:hypothetical protein